MIDRQAILTQFLDYLESSPPDLDYLGEVPQTPTSFDPYQMVSEWIALRQEMKQQGKLMQAAQEQLQRQLAEAQATLASPAPAAELMTLEKRFEKEQESLLRNLIHVLDALDHATGHWQDQKMSLPFAPSPPLPSQSTPTSKVAHWLMMLSHKLVPPIADPTESPADLVEMIESDRQGIQLIRQNLLDLLKQQQVTPILAQGQPFDTKTMYAIARQPGNVPANTVIQEVERGYRWRDRILREAKVIVAS
jgi:molecular chaperone GrpE